MIYILLEWLVFLALPALAFAWGQREEKLTAALLVFQISIGLLIGLATDWGVDSVISWVNVIVDAILVIAFMIIVINTRVVWPIFALGFQLAELVIDIRQGSRNALYDSNDLSYSISCSWFVIISLLCGIFLKAHPTSYIGSFYRGAASALRARIIVLK